MAKSIEIRVARQDEAEAISALIASAYADARQRIPDLPDVTSGVAEEISAGRVRVAAGLAGVLIAAEHDGAMHVMNVAVAPEARGRGIGGALMAEAERLARATGLSQLVLATHRDLPENVALYRHLGWEVTGEDGNRIFMARQLG